MMRYEQAKAISGSCKTLVELIETGDHSSTGLTEELGVSKPTICRGVEFLKTQGHAIQAVGVSRRWAYRLLDVSLRESVDGLLDQQGAATG